MDTGGNNIEPNVNSNVARKYRELFTFSYFQSSAKSLYSHLRTDGFGALVDTGDKTVNIAADDSIGDVIKIVPDARRVMAKEEFYTVAENDGSVNTIIAQQAIYQLGSGFSELNTSNLREFENLIIYLQHRGVNVELYLPSWYPSLYDHFCENPSYSGVIKLEDYLRKFALERDIVVHGSYNPYICNIHKEDYADWLHLKSEKMLYNYLYIKDES